MKNIALFFQHKYYTQRINFRSRQAIQSVFIGNNLAYVCVSLTFQHYQNCKLGSSGILG